MVSSVWAWGGVDEREAGEVTHKQVPKEPGHRLLPTVKVGIQQVFWGFRKLPPAAATQLWLMGGPLCPPQEPQGWRTCWAAQPIKV